MEIHTNTVSNLSAQRPPTLFHVSKNADMTAAGRRGGTNGTSLSKLMDRRRSDCLDRHRSWRRGQRQG